MGYVCVCVCWVWDRYLLAQWPLPLCKARLDDIMTGHILGSNLFRHACGLLSPPHPLSWSLSDRAGRLHYPPVRSMLAMTGSSTGHPTIDTADSAVCVCVMINMACGSHDVDDQVMSWSVKTPHSFTINIVPCYFPFLLPQQTTFIFCIIIFTIWQGLPLLFYLMGEQPNHRPAEQPHSNTVMFLCFLPSWKIL